MGKKEHSHEDLEKLFREVMTNIVVASEAAFGALPKGYAWVPHNTIYNLRIVKLGDDEYSLELGGDKGIVNKRRAIAFFLMVVAEELIKHG